MLDNIISNKYFVIALIIALIVIIYLYSQKKSCSIEPMRNIDVTVVSDEIDEKPWAEDGNNGKYRRVDNGTRSCKQNKYNSRNKNNGKNRGILKRTDENYGKYIENENNNRQKKRGRIDNDIPQPLDMRPDLSQCQPCICPGDDDSDSDEEYENKRRRNRNKNRNAIKN